MLDKVLFKLIGKNKKKLFLIATLQVINFLFTLGASFLFCYVILELINNTNLTSLYYLLLIALFVLFKFLINRIINKSRLCHNGYYGLSLHRLFLDRMP